MTIEPISSVMTVQAQNTAAARNTATKVTTEENPSEYNPANVKAADKLDQTTAVVENAQSKDQNNTSADANSEQQQQVTNEQIKKAVEKLNKNMMSHSEAVFGIHEATNRITIKIIDKDTKKVIKELPPEKTLDMIAKVWEMAGILVDEKMATNVPGLYAAGDCTGGMLQIAKAVYQGAQAGTSIVAEIRKKK